MVSKVEKKEIPTVLVFLEIKIKYPTILVV